MEKKEYLDVAKIINTHGVMGELKLDLRCDGPEVFKKIKNCYIDNIEYSVEKFRAIANGFCLIKLSKINNLDDAIKYKNKLIYAKRTDIPKKKDSHFICDMIGLNIIDLNNGTIYGTLEDVQQVSSQELFYIQTENGQVIMPNVPAFVKKIDEESGIYVTPIPGFFDGEGVDAN